MNGIFIFLWFIAWSDEIYIAQDTNLDYPIAVPYKSDSICCIWREGTFGFPTQLYVSFFDGSSWSFPQYLLPDSLTYPADWWGRPGVTVDSSNGIWGGWFYGQHPIKQQEHGIYTITYDGTQWGVPAYAETSYVFELSMCTAKDGRIFVGWVEDIYVSAQSWGAICIGWRELASWSSPLVIAYPHLDHLPFLAWDYSHPFVSADTSNGVFIAYQKWYWDTLHSVDTAIIIDQFKDDSLIEVGRKQGGNNWEPVIDVDYENRLRLAWVTDRDGDTNVYSSCYQDSVWLWDMLVTADSGADLEPSIVFDDSGGVPLVAWTSSKDSSIWAAYYAGGNWHKEKVSKDSSAYHENPYIIVGPKNKLWIFWRKSKLGTNAICCSWRELVNTEEYIPQTLNPKPQMEVYPNPLTQKTVIRYSLSVDRETNDSTIQRLTIYDLTGRLVKSFPITNKQLPITKVVWDARNDKGKTVPNGIYFLNLNIGEIREVKKLILIR